MHPAVAATGGRCGKTVSAAAATGLRPVWTRPASTGVLACCLVLAAVGFGAAAWTVAVPHNGYPRPWLVTVLSVATAVLVGRGLVLGRPLTTVHVVLAAAGCATAVVVLRDGHLIDAQLAVLAGAAALVWPTSARPQPEALPSVWTLVDRTYRDPLAPFAMDRQKRYVFSAGATAAVAYRVRAGFAVVGGDPIGDPGGYDDAVAAFTALCRARGWRVLVLGASPRAVELWTRQSADNRPLRAIPIGCDVVVDVHDFHLGGRAWRNLRQAVQRTHNAGMTTTVLAEADLDSGLRAELLDVARVSGKSVGTQRGFSMMLDGTLSGRYPGTWLIVARDRRGAVQGFHRYATAGAGSVVTLDLPWRRPDAPNGTDERLTVDMINWAAAHGARYVSLAFAPFPDLFARRTDHPALQAIRMLLHTADRLIKLESLYRYVRKYHAAGQRRYVLLTPLDLLPALAVLLTLEFLPHHTAGPPPVPIPSPPAGGAQPDPSPRIENPVNTNSSGAVVVGIDGSAAAVRAALWAVAEAKARSVPLRLVAVLNDCGAEAGQECDLERQYAETCLREAGAAVARNGSGVTVDTAIVPGPPAAALVAASRDATMIVVGSAGIGRVARLLLGSTAAEVAASAHCPVAIIRHHPDGDPAPTWVAVGVDSPTADSAAIETALHEARIRGVPLLAVGVREHDSEDVPYDELDRLVSGYQQRFPDIHVHAIATRADLQTFLAERNDRCGLAVLPESDANRLAQVIGPHAHPMRRHAECSVLVTH